MDATPTCKPSRLAHYLKVTRSDRQPTNLVALQAHLISEPVLGQKGLAVDRAGSVAMLAWRREKECATCRTEYATRDTSDLWAALAARCRRGSVTWLFCWDALRTFAALGLWEELEADRWVISGHDHREGWEPGQEREDRWRGYAVMENPPTIILCRPRDRAGSLKIVDVRNYGCVSWTDFERAGDSDHWTNDSPFEDNTAPRDWCLRRCRSIYHWVETFCDLLLLNGWGSLQNTAGSQAMYTWKRKYLRTQVLVHDNPEALALEGRALYGGRCECRFLGTVAPWLDQTEIDRRRKASPKDLFAVGPLWQLDFNSLYPAVAADYPVPTILSDYFDQPTLPEVARLVATRAVIADVRIETDIPLYPVRTEEREVVYPVGSFWTTLAGPEFTLATDLGHLRQVGAIAGYKTANLFREYVQALYGQRCAAKQRGDNCHAAICKALLNRLWGKFGQKYRVWKDQRTELATHPYAVWHASGKDGRLARFRSLGWHCQEEIEADWHREACPAIAAWITSLARCTLARAICTVPERSLFYYDTDSLWVDRAGYQALDRAGLINGGLLGHLKVVAEYNRVEFLGLKHYIADGRRVCAGVPPGSTFGADGKWHYRKHEGVMQALYRKRPPGCTLTDATWAARALYRHGRVGADGWTVPFTLSAGVTPDEVRSLDCGNGERDGEDGSAL